MRTLPINALTREQQNILQHYSEHFGGTISTQQRPAPSRPGSNSVNGAGEETAQPKGPLKTTEELNSQSSKVDSSESWYTVWNLQRLERTMAGQKPNERVKIYLTRLITVILFPLAKLAWTFAKRIWNTVLPPVITNSISQNVF